MAAARLLVLLGAAQLSSSLIGTDNVRVSGMRGSPVPVNSRRRGTDAALNLTAAAHRDASGARSRTRRQTLAVPEGAVIGVIPKFGWLLYQGEDHEELDFVVETEFLYRFPGAEESEVGDVRRSDGQNHSHDGEGSFYDADFDYDGWLSQHRQKRMVRDKQKVYKSVAGIFSRLGMEGKACLLKTICEITGNPLLHDGLLGELLNMAFIPSHTVDGAPDELREYREAEELGSSGRSCQAAFSQCPVSLFRQLYA